MLELQYFDVLLLFNDEFIRWKSFFLFFLNFKTVKTVDLNEP